MDREARGTCRRRRGRGGAATLEDQRALAALAQLILSGAAPPAAEPPAARGYVWSPAAHRLVPKTLAPAPPSTGGALPAKSE